MQPLTAHSVTPSKTIGSLVSTTLMPLPAAAVTTLMLITYVKAVPQWPADGSLVSATPTPRAAATAISSTVGTALSAA